MNNSDLSVIRHALDTRTDIPDALEALERVSARLAELANRPELAEYVAATDEDGEQIGVKPHRHGGWIAWTLFQDEVPPEGWEQLYRKVRAGQGVEATS